MNSVEDRRIEVQKILKSLSLQGLSYNQIAKALQGRVTSRTLYRWGHGEVAPQRESDLTALRELMESVN